MRVKHLLSVAMSFPTGLALGEPAAEPHDPLVIGHRYTLNSEILGETRPLLIGLPDRYEASDARYPTLYVLEADEIRFHDVTAAARTLAQQGRIPPLVVVAVPVANRMRDLTPALSKPGPGTRSDAGSADRFLSFLTRELVPFVDGSFRTTGHRTLTGVSFGGLFTTDVLVKAPCVFDAYVAVSPSLWWDDRALIRHLAEAVQQPCATADRLVFTVADEGARMTGPLEEATERLRQSAPATFHWQLVEVPGETHETTASAGTRAGLRAVFADWSIDDGSINDAPALEQLFQRRAARYGVSPSVPAGSYFQLGWRLFGEGHASQARDLFERALEVDPDHTLSAAGLGLALEQLGSYDDARLNLRRAEELARRESNPMLPQIQVALDRVEAHITEGAVSE